MPRSAPCPPGSVHVFVHYKGIRVIQEKHSEFKGIPLYRTDKPNQRHLVAVFEYHAPTARGLSEPKPLTFLHDVHSITHRLTRPQPELLTQLFTMAQADLLYTQKNFPDVINGQVNGLPWYPKRLDILFS